MDANGKAEKNPLCVDEERKSGKKKKSTGTLNPGVQMQVGVGRELGDTVEGLSLINKTVLVIKAFIGAVCMNKDDRHSRDQSVLSRSLLQLL